MSTEERALLAEILYDVKAIKASVGLIEKPPELVGIDYIQHMLSCKTRASAYEWLKRFKIKPVSRGKYDRKKIENSIGRERYKA